MFDSSSKYITTLAMFKASRKEKIERTYCSNGGIIVCARSRSYGNKTSANSLAVTMSNQLQFQKNEL